MDTDPELFFAIDSPSQNAALRICAMCRVRTECLAYALDERITYGVFGGTPPRWREDLLRRRPHVESWRDLLISARAEFIRAHLPDTDA